MVDTVQRVIECMGARNSTWNMAKGGELRNVRAGSGFIRGGSFASIRRAMARWPDQTFTERVNASVPWPITYAGEKDKAENTGVELRRLGLIIHDGRRWVWAFRDAKLYAKQVVNANDDGGVLGKEQDRGNGSIVVHPRDNIGHECWPDKTIGAFPAERFNGRPDRALFAAARCFVIGVQARLVLLDPNGPDDRYKAHKVIQVGHDGFVIPRPGARYKTLGGEQTSRFGAGYPFGVMDLDCTAWLDVTSEWQWFIMGTPDGVAGYIADQPPPWDFTWGKKVDWATAETLMSLAEFKASGVPDFDAYGDSPAPAPAPTPNPTPAPEPAPVPAPEPDPPNPVALAIGRLHAIRAEVDKAISLLADAANGAPTPSQPERSDEWLIARIAEAVASVTTHTLNASAMAGWLAHFKKPEFAVMDDAALRAALAEQAARDTAKYNWPRAN